jgi:hypothetical protein
MKFDALSKKMFQEIAPLFTALRSNRNIWKNVKLSSKLSIHDPDVQTSFVYVNGLGLTLCVNLFYAV